MFAKLPKAFFLDLGPRTRVKVVETFGWPTDVPPFPTARFRGIALMPKSLDEIQEAASEQFKANGYPCATVAVKAFPEQGRVAITATPNVKRIFGPIMLPESREIDPHALARYRAFHTTDSYDYRLLELTERRIRADGVVSDVVFVPSCEKEQFHLTQRLTAGAQRYVSLGLGFDTEQLLIAKAHFSLSRLTHRGSTLQSDIYASQKIQSWSNLAKFDLWPPTSRTLLYASVDLERRSETLFETISVTGKTGVETSLESAAANWDFKAGPVFEFIRVRRGDGLPFSRNMGLEFSETTTSHLYEYFSDSPVSGYKFGLSVQSTMRLLGSTFAATRAKLSGEKIWQLWNDYKSDLVLGLRGFLATTINHEGTTDYSRIPPTYLNMLGGSDDMRGFGRLELSKGGAGAPSSGYLGFEMRLARVFPVEPIAFLDAGVLGPSGYEWTPPYYLSPGFGLRYRSPFGTLRGTAAYGYSVGGGAPQDQFSHAQFFVSFGEEF